MSDSSVGAVLEGAVESGEGADDAAHHGAEWCTLRDSSGVIPGAFRSCTTHDVRDPVHRTHGGSHGVVNLLEIVLVESLGDGVVPVLASLIPSE